MYTTGMSAWATQVKLSIIMTMTVILVFVVSVVLFFLFYRPPSCNDGVQNGSEAGIDCGGNCPTACSNEPKKLFDVWTRAFPIADGLYAAVAYIENQNKDLYVQEVQYEIELYDKSGSFITRSSETTPIMANSVTPIFVPRIVTGNREVSDVSFRFTEEPIFTPQSGSYNFSITDIQRDVEGDSPRISAMAANVGESLVRKADFVAILYDEDDNAIAASNTFEENIAPSEERFIQFTWVHPLTLRKGKCSADADGMCDKKVKRIEIIPIVGE